MTAWLRCTHCAIRRSDMSENRRDFLRAGGAAAAASFLNLNPRAIGANEKVTLALIGGRNQGRHDAVSAMKDGAQIKTLCDIDDAILEKTGAVLGEKQGKR